MLVVVGFDVGLGVGLGVDVAAGVGLAAGLGEGFNAGSGEGTGVGIEVGEWDGLIVVASVSGLTGPRVVSSAGPAAGTSAAADEGVTVIRSGASVVTADEQPTRDNIRISPINTRAFLKIRFKRKAPWTPTVGTTSAVILPSIIHLNG